MAQVAAIRTIVLMMGVGAGKMLNKTNTIVNGLRAPSTFHHSYGWGNDNDNFNGNDKERKEVLGSPTHEVPLALQIKTMLLLIMIMGLGPSGMGRNSWFPNLLRRCFTMMII